MWLLRATFWSIAGLAVLLMGLWLVIQWGILPRLDAWRPRLEAWATSTTGLQVTIGRLSGSGDLWAPVLTLHDLRLHDRPGHEALRLAKVDAVITPGSLIPQSLTNWRPHLELLAIDALHLELRRDPRGRIYLAGLPMDSAGTDDNDGRAADWLFSQDDIRLRGASLTWHDEGRTAEPLNLTQVDIDLRNRSGHHQLSLSATPPEGWGSRFTATADFGGPWLSLSGLQHPGDWRQWAGHIQARWPKVDVSRLRRHVDLPFDLLEGRGRLDTRIDIAPGQLTGATAELQLEAVTLRLGRQLPPLALSRIAGQLEVQHNPLGSRLKARRLSFQLLPAAAADLASRADRSRPDPVTWPATDLDLTLKGAPGEWTGGAFQASLVDLGLLARSSAHVPLAGPMRRLLDETRPHGQVRGFSYTWSGDLEAPAHWRARGDATDLSLVAAPATADLTSTATPGRPGLTGARVRFDTSDTGGQADVQVSGGTLDFPGVFAQPRVDLRHLQADVRWKVRRTGPPSRAGPVAGHPAIEVEIRHAAFETPDGQGELSGQWKTGPVNGPVFGRGGWLPGQIDLKARVAHLQANRVHRYLPLGLPDSVRQYVEHAVLTGQARDVVARVRGDVFDFPYAGTDRGEFRIDGQFSGVTFDSVPGSTWPHYTDGSGQLVFDRQRMAVRQVRARLGRTGQGSIALSGVEGGIDDFMHDATLRLAGQAEGRLDDVLQFMTSSPVDGWLDHAFAPARADGQARLQLKVAVPLLHAEQSAVQGEMHISDASLQMRPDTPALRALNGQLEFTEKTFRLHNARTQVAGGPLNFEGHLGDDGTLHFQGQGTATATGLRELRELGALTTVARLFDGQTAYRLGLDLGKGGPVVQVDSDLAGITSDWPAPLGKTAAQTLALQVRVQPQPDGQESLTIRAGPDTAPLLQAEYLRDAQDPMKVVRGHVQVGPPDGQPWPARGVAASIVQPSLSVNAWQDWLERTRMAGHLPAGGSAGGPAAGDGYLPRQIRLRVDDLAVMDQRLSHVRTTLQRSEDSGPRELWLGSIEADQLTGRFEVQPPASRQAPPAVKARLSRLVLPHKTAPGGAARRGPAPLPSPLPPLPPLTPRTQPLPRLDIVVDRLEYAGRLLGRLELDAGQPPGKGTTGPGLPDWPIHRLKLEHPEASLSAVGQWSADSGSANPAGQTRMTLRLDVGDSGRLLDQLGWPGTLQGGAGHLGGQLQWPGTPSDFTAGRLAGNLQLNVASGLILQADPGNAGRLLGVLSLQSLPRRFLMDFRDVYQKGFGFDEIDGDIQIAQGLATTRNLRVRGLQAVVLTEGSADLRRQTQDLRVWVVPDLNAGAASLAYAVINPAIGLGTLLTQIFLQRPLAEAATREFRVTGAWDAPQMTSVNRWPDASPAASSENP